MLTKSRVQHLLSSEHQLWIAASHLERALTLAGNDGAFAVMVVGELVSMELNEPVHYERKLVPGGEH